MTNHSNDLLGEKVTTLVDNYQNRGLHTVLFVTKNFASGAYIYKLASNDHTDNLNLKTVVSGRVISKIFYPI